MLEIISRYQLQSYLDYLRYLDIYNHIYKVVVLRVSVIKTQ